MKKPSQSEISTTLLAQGRAVKRNVIKRSEGFRKTLFLPVLVADEILKEVLVSGSLKEFRFEIEEEQEAGIFSIAVLSDQRDVSGPASIVKIEPSGQDGVFDEG